MKRQDANNRLMGRPTSTELEQAAIIKSQQEANQAAIDAAKSTKKAPAKKKAAKKAVKK